VEKKERRKPDKKKEGKEARNRKEEEMNTAL